MKYPRNQKCPTRIVESPGAERPASVFGNQAWVEMGFGAVCHFGSQILAPIFMVFMVSILVSIGFYGFYSDLPPDQLAGESLPFRPMQSSTSRDQCLGVQTLGFLLLRRVYLDCFNSPDFFLGNGNRILSKICHVSIEAAALLMVIFGLRLSPPPKIPMSLTILFNTLGRKQGFSFQMKKSKKSFQRKKSSFSENFQIFSNSSKSIFGWFFHFAKTN